MKTMTDPVATAAPALRAAERPRFCGRRTSRIPDSSPSRPAEPSPEPSSTTMISSSVSAGNAWCAIDRDVASARVPSRYMGITTLTRECVPTSPSPRRLCAMQPLEQFNVTQCSYGDVELLQNHFTAALAHLAKLLRWRSDGLGDAGRKSIGVTGRGNPPHPGVDVTIQAPTPCQDHGQSALHRFKAGIGHSFVS